ncbi:MAG: PIN domain-containing protein [Ignavibacteriae bacterium]|nr:PIN domain-containing protein [Ignavibacteriota bacterium]
MIDKIFFDTNLIVYMFDKSESVKREKVKDLLNQFFGKARLIISTQVVNEFLNVSLKYVENSLTEKKALDKIDFLNELFEIVSLDLGTIVVALNIKNKYKFSYWDSLIIASAIENECNLLFTEDLNHDQIINSKLLIKNPLL